MVPILGDWEVIAPDGAPIIDGATCSTTFVIDPDGTIVSEVYLDQHDGQGPVRIERERSTLTPLGSDGLLYEWYNETGTTGIYYWSHDRNQFESIVLTGPNTGHRSALRR